MNNNDELRTELEERGTAEISKGVVLPVTQALGETEDEAEFLMFGVLRKEKFIPIEQACAKCTFWNGKFETIEACRVRQGREGKARGFNRIICSEQFSR